MHELKKLLRFLGAAITQALDPEIAGTTLMLPDMAIVDAAVPLKADNESRRRIRPRAQDQSLGIKFGRVTSVQSMRTINFSLRLRF